MKWKDGSDSIKSLPFWVFDKYWTMVVNSFPFEQNILTLNSVCSIQKKKKNKCILSVGSEVLPVVELNDVTLLASVCNWMFIVNFVYGVAFWQRTERWKGMVWHIITYNDFKIGSQCAWHALVHAQQQQQKTNQSPTSFEIKTMRCILMLRQSPNKQR